MSQIVRKLSRAEKDEWEEKLSLLNSTAAKLNEKPISPIIVAAIALNLFKEDIPPGSLLARQTYRISGYIPLEEELLWSSHVRERREQKDKIIFKLDSEVTSREGNTYFKLQTILVKNKELKSLNQSFIDETENTGFEFTEAMVENFLELSGDPNPIHRKDSNSSDCKIIVPGLLISLLLTDTYLPKLSSCQLEFHYHRPVFTGDKVYMALKKPGVYAIFKGDNLCTEMRIIREDI